MMIPGGAPRLDFDKNDCGANRLGFVEFCTCHVPSLLLLLVPLLSLLSLVVVVSMMLIIIIIIILQSTIIKLIIYVNNTINTL